MTRPSNLLIPAIVAVLVILVGPVQSGEDNQQQSGDELSFLDGFTMVVLEDGDIPSLHAAKDLIQSYGGRIAIMSPPSLLMGWIPFELRGELIGKAGIKDIYYTEVFAHEIETKDHVTRAMVGYFNSVVRGEVQAEHRSVVQAQSALQSPPTRKSDSFEASPLEEAAFLENLRSVGLDVQSLKDRGLYPDLGSQYALGNSDYMSGTAALTVFFMESDGSGSDPDQYTWTIEDMQSYLSGIATGLAWWSNKALSFSGCSVTFLIYYYSAQDPRCQQWVEPILHDTSYEDVWVKAIMSNFGYTSGHRFSRVTSFNTWQRSTYQTDRAYSAFIAYNPASAPVAFADGHTAYAYRWGPYTVLLFNLVGSPTSQVFAHESGHIFGACDEYDGGCTHCGVCANGIDNGNCEVCAAHSVDCMMKGNTWNLCNYTPGQLGWDGVVSPCTPTPPPPLPTPAVAVSYPAQMLQGLDGTITVGGSNFFSGAWVDLGPNIFVHKTTLIGAESLKVDVTVLNDAPTGFYDVVVRNRDFQQSTLSNALEVLPTTRHYFSPIGGDQFPYITPATAATALEDAIAAGFDGDTLFVPTMTISGLSLQLDKGVLLHGGWSSDFSTRDLESGKTILQPFFNISIVASGTQGGLDGFIVENGRGSSNVVPFAGDFGGGVEIVQSGALIANCEIRTNAASDGLSIGAGGGIYGYNSTVNIRDCYIWGNGATFGGGLYLYGCSGTVSGNTISANTVTLSTTQPLGGGIYLSNCDNVDLDGNTIDGNTGAQDGGGLLIENCSNVTVDGGVVSDNSATSDGGGAQLIGSTVQFTGVKFERNAASIIGGGVAASDTSGLTVSECEFEWNTATLAGGIFSTDGHAGIAHSLFVGNSGASAGGAVYVNAAPTGSITGNTMDRNDGGFSAGGILVVGSGIDIFNNVVTNTAGKGIFCDGAPSPNLSYNLVWNSSTVDYDGCAPGSGAISGDPMYADTSMTDYHLTVHSPAIDAGQTGVSFDDPDGSRGDLGRYGSHTFDMDQPSYPKNLTVDVGSGNVVLRWNKNPEPDVIQYAIYCDSASGFVPGTSNFVTFAAGADTTADLGAPGDTAYYRILAVDTSGYASGYSNEATMNPPTAIDGQLVQYDDRLYQNIPNPFNPVTTIRYELRASTVVTLLVYDVAGRRVRRLESGVKNAGLHSVSWNGTNDRGERVSSGIYFYRLKAGGLVQTRKMVLLK